MNPQADAQTIIYKGKKLIDDQIVGDLLKSGISQSLVGEKEAKFHLLID